MRRRGASLQQIANVFHLTPGRIHQILAAPAQRELRFREVEIEAELEALLGEHHVVHARIRQLTDELRTVREEIQADRIDRILGV